jgi:hypothetical protein
MKLVTEIYEVTRGFPGEERYGLTNQLRRTAVSVPSNIAEGQARFSQKEFHHFLSSGSWLSSRNRDAASDCERFEIPPTSQGGSAALCRRRTRPDPERAHRLNQEPCGVGRAVFLRTENRELRTDLVQLLNQRPLARTPRVRAYAAKFVVEPIQVLAQESNNLHTEIAVFTQKREELATWNKGCCG